MRLPALAALAAVTVICAPTARAAENDPSVPTYHADACRSGHYVVPGLTWTNAGDMRLDAAFDGHVPGHVYAQPLYWHPAGATSGLVIVATEDNVLVALDANTGSTVWKQSLGPSVALDAQPCGNIDPLGITGTPVIDERSGAIYLDAMIDHGGQPRHLVFGLSFADGTVLPGWPVDMLRIWAGSPRRRISSRRPVGTSSMNWAASILCPCDLPGGGPGTALLIALGRSKGVSARSHRTRRYRPPAR
jgi:PQQ enzyme repeat